MIYLTVGPEQADNEQLGKLLWAFREEADASRTTAAEHLGVSSEYIRLIERGKRVPSHGLMREILKHYKVDFFAGRRKMVIKNEIEVTFTSRILETRQPKHIRNRSEMIGEIVGLLIEADDELLDTVRMFLLVKARV